MPDTAFIESNFFAFVVLPLLIFLARVVDVSLGTIRLISVSKGYRRLAPFVAFFEVLIWIITIGQIMKNLTHPICYIAYAGGFAAGNYIGICLTDKMSLGMVLIQVLTKTDATKLIESLRANEYGLTTVDGQGAYGRVKLLFTVLPKSDADYVTDLIKKFNPQAFYTIEEIGFVEKGFFPKRKKMFTLMRPFRKGK